MIIALFHDRQALEHKQQIGQTMWVKYAQRTHTHIYIDMFL